MLQGVVRCASEELSPCESAPDQSEVGLVAVIRERCGDIATRRSLKIQDLDRCVAAVIEGAEVNVLNARV